jgi:hypothetical protein
MAVLEIGMCFTIISHLDAASRQLDTLALAR